MRVQRSIWCCPAHKIKRDRLILLALIHISESICSGAFDPMVIATEKIDFSMERSFEGYVLSGPRSDFMCNRVERRSELEYFKEFFDYIIIQSSFLKSHVSGMRDSQYIVYIGKCLPTSNQSYWRGGNTF